MLPVPKELDYSVAVPPCQGEVGAKALSDQGLARLAGSPPCRHERLRARLPDRGRHVGTNAEHLAGKTRRAAVSAARAGGDRRPAGARPRCPPPRPPPATAPAAPPRPPPPT